jgi:hypothetical protein
MKVLRPEQCAVWDGKPCAACDEDIELEKEKKELEIRIEKIDLRRRALRTVMNKNHDRLILRFPPEIASHIFIQYAPPSALFNKGNRSTPLYLGAVCQKWRQLAWATPQLWSSLLVGSIECGRYNCSSRSDLPQLIADWLERSASLPLTIRFDQVPVYHDVINILNKHSAKWYDMHFGLPPRYLHRLHGSSDSPGNILRRLVLCSSLSSTGDSDCSTFSMKSKPSPTDLTLLMVGLRHVDIMWNNLTVASVDYIGVDECFELIRRAPLLETLTLSRISVSSCLFPIPNTRIICPHLHSLELSRIAEENVVAKILDSLCLPSLEQWIHDQPSMPLDNMISFIGCLSCLKIFKITVEEPDYHPVTRLLCLLPSLEFLQLRGPTYRPSDELLPVLWASAQSPLFLPRLQSLEFACEFYSPWKYLHLIFTPSHRQSLRVKIDSKHNWFLREIKDEGMKILLELVDKGFDLRVVKSNGQIDLLQKYKEAQHF